MRVAVVSDIHSNLHALEAVLAAIDEAAPDEVWCLGDLVGYGPRPNECCATIADPPLVLVGHSHVALRVVQSDDEVAGGVAPDGTELELGCVRALLNPGSVGQPRDGDPRAAYLLLDLDAQHASFRRVEYAVEQTQREMRNAGLPEMLAARLELGL